MNKNEPAFPKVVPDGDPSQDGLTKREYFAAKAMQGILSGPAAGKFKSNMFNKHEGVIMNAEAVCKWAIHFADELLKQLKA